jgi:hypothetical protein
MSRFETIKDEKLNKFISPKPSGCSDMPFHQKLPDHAWQIHIKNKSFIITTTSSLFRFLE